MALPVLFAVDDDPDALSRLQDALRTRYGNSYGVETERSVQAALSRLQGHAESGIEVALLLADQWMPGTTGVEFLAEAGLLHPHARRLLMIDVGDVSAERPIAQAMTLNQLEFYFGKQWESPEEELYPVTGEALRRWALTRRPRYEKAKVVGDSPRARAIHRMLERNNVTSGLYAPDSPAARHLIRQHDIDTDRLPAIVLYDGRVVTDPTDQELAGALGGSTAPGSGTYDVAIVGAGPAGLAAAVYAGSEGLRLVAVESDNVGGQAGASAKIRNYLGFPWGISGLELAERAGRQAAQVGAELVVTRPVTALRSEGLDRVVTLSNGAEIRSRTVIVATGATYRRLDVPGIDALVDAGVFYGAAVTDVQVLEDANVYIVGGGNSAGQAAAHLAAAGARVGLLVRRDSLAATMTDYLVREIGGSANIDVLFNTQVASVIGEQRLRGLVLVDTKSGTERRVEAEALYVYTGATPHTDWLDGVVARDRWGYILTGSDVPADTGERDEPPRSPLLLETSVPGVFAAGDARSGSVKRVAAAVGEGSTAVLMVREYLKAIG
ncbi:MAG: fused response regulator/thioredoxin-disulfide reductase [Nitriliruptorales bacterium]|nr:fused response regulator/thioredoxin-disulfide reductase [Nitriliruptorales bacterium]